MDRDSFSHDQDIFEILKGLESKKAEYPPELLAARRQLFIEQLERRIQPDAETEPTAEVHELVEIFASLKSLDPEYPPERLVHRRAIFKHQVEKTSRESVWNILRSGIQNIFAGLVTSSRSTSTKFSRASVIAAGIAMLVFVAFALYGNGIQTSTVPLQNEIPTVKPGLITSTLQAEIICKDGLEPPLCLALKPENSQNLTSPANGKARPAVAKDTVPGRGQAAYLNDGLYGPGAGWVSNSPNSWIKIDLGDTTAIDTVAFSRDRLGTLHDGDPGQFVIAVAIADNIYADGNSSNDEREYIAVYNSRQVDFDGTISGSETVIASFNLQRARFIKITFENAGTAIDEVEAFVSRPSRADHEPTISSPRDESSPDQSTPVPTNTPLPLETASPMPTATPLPSDTAAPLPTDTSTPANTPLPVDTATPWPLDTDTPIATDNILPPHETSVPAAPVTSLPTDNSPFPPPVDVPAPLPAHWPIPTDAAISP